MEKLYIIVITI